MPERSSISQVVQLGVESTSGTAVAANKLLQSIGIEPTPSIQTSQFRPMGSKFQTLAVIGKESVEFALMGKPTYDEIIYPLSSLLGPATVTTTGTTGKQWAFKPSVITEDTPKTFTVEQGSAARAHKFAYALVTGLSLSIDRDNVDLSGSGIGQRLTDGITITPSPTTLPLIPMLPSTVCIYLDSSAATVGTTRLTRVLGSEWGLTGKYNPLWTVDCTIPSWATHIETEPALTSGLTLAADSNGMALLNDVRAGSTKFMRIEMTGGQINSGPAVYKFTIDMPVKITETAGFSDSDGVYAVGWSFVGVNDSTFDSGAGGALTIKVINSTAVL